MNTQFGTLLREQVRQGIEGSVTLITCRKSRWIKYIFAAVNSNLVFFSSAVTVFGSVEHMFRAGR